MAHYCPSDCRRRENSALDHEDQVKLTLAVEAKNDLMYDISLAEAGKNAKKETVGMRKRGGQASDSDLED